MRPRRAWRVAFDAVVVAGLLLARWALRPRGRVTGDEEAVALLDLPAGWASRGVAQDWLLIGPDAGAWAEALVAARQGLPLDPFRLPVYPFLARLVPEDVVYAGHLVNHLAGAVVPAVGYLLGRDLAGRGVGLLAAGALVAHPGLLEAAGLFGVDPTFQAVTAALLWATWRAIDRGWLAAVGAGVLAGFALATHFLGAVVAPLALATLALRRGAWWRRLAAVAVAALAALAVARRMLVQQAQQPDLALLMGVYGTGVTGRAGAPDAQRGRFAEAVASVSERLPDALPSAWGQATADLVAAGLPGEAVAVAVGVGLLAPQRRGRRWGWRAPVFLAASCAPLVLLAAADAPGRYARYGLVLVVVAAARGALWPLGSLDRWRWAPRGLPRLVAGTALAALVVGSLWERRPGPHSLVRATQDLRVAAHLAATYPAAEGVVTRSQSIPFLSGRDRCPRQTCAAEAGDPLHTCHHRLMSECGGAGAVPYVAEHTETFGPGDARSRAYEDFVLSRFETTLDDDTGERRVRVVAVDRDVLEAIAGPAPAAVGDGPPAPPPPVFGVVPPGAGPQAVPNPRPR